MVEAQIKDIQIQPLKGGGSMKLNQARMTMAGMETVDGKIKDHGLVVVSEEVDDQGCHNFLTQRAQVNPNNKLFVPGDPRIVLVRPEAINGQLVLNFGDKNEVVDPGEENDDPSNIIKMQVWEYRGEGVEVPIFSEAASDHLGRRVRVGRATGPWNRMARDNFIKNNNPLRSQDGYPVHPVSREDVVALFGAISAEPDPERFRYQLLLEGLKFREIHLYDQAELNGVTILQPNPCDRCEVTGIDYKTGAFSRIKPLAGLSKLGVPRWLRRENEKKQIVGENWLPQGETVVTIGDTVTFTDLRQPPLQFES
jgi:uncharacterized protein YcbX